MRGRYFSEPELGPEVRRQPEPAGEDRQREPRDDLARAQRDGEKGVDRGHRRSGCSGCEHGREQDDGARAVEALCRPEADRRPEQHHPLDAEVEDAGSLREQLAECRVEQRRSVEHGLRQHEHEQAVVDGHATGSVAGPPVRRGLVKRTR